MSLRWLTWMAGFPAGLATFLILLIPQNIPLWAHIFLLFNTFTWLVGYQVGLRLNLKKQRLPKHKKLLWHLLTLILTPFVGIMETFSVFIAPLQMHNFDRTPTPKSAEPETENLEFYTIIQQPCQEELIQQGQ